MTKEKLKSEFHKLIDDIDDERMLKNFFEVFSEYIKDCNSIDIIDDLKEDQKRRLSSSLQQVRDGKLISNDKMKDEIKKWLIK